MAAFIRKHWLALIVALLVLIAGYVAAGPYLTIHAIRSAVVERDPAALEDQVDFEAVRESVKLQLKDRMVRSAGDSWQSSLLGAIGLSLGGGMIDTAVEAMVTPVGLGALMEGRALWKRTIADVSPDAAAAAPDPEPLRNADYRYESASRFTATVRDEDGDPIVFVLTREGLQWKLSDVRLPPAGL